MKSVYSNLYSFGLVNLLIQILCFFASDTMGDDDHNYTKCWKNSDCPLRESLCCYMAEPDDMVCAGMETCYNSADSFSFNKNRSRGRLMNRLTGTGNKRTGKRRLGRRMQKQLEKRKQLMQKKALKNIAHYRESQASMYNDGYSRLKH